MDRSFVYIRSWIWRAGVTGLLTWYNLVSIDMFRALHVFDLSSEHVFTVTVGASSKQTAASWHLLEPADVISTIGILNGSVHPQDP